jgi:hypothetical protein
MTQLRGRGPGDVHGHDHGDGHRHGLEPAQARTKFSMYFLKERVRPPAALHPSAPMFCIRFSAKRLELKVVRYSLTRQQRYKLYEVRIIRTRLDSDSCQLTRKLICIRDILTSIHVNMSTYDECTAVLLYPWGYQGVLYRYRGTNTTRI